MNDAVMPRAGLRNQLFAKMRSGDWALLAPHLEPVTLKERQVVEVPGKPITHVHFIEIGVVSVVAVNADDHRIEVGVIGNEGMTGVPLVMGDTKAQHSAYMQIAGSGYRIAAAPFCEALKQSPSLMPRWPMAAPSWKSAWRVGC
jgi:CRP-like cAMP-binding protein